MSVDERTRHELHGKFEELLGSVELAGALMELLPPVGWGEVATKSDLVALETRLELRMDAAILRMDTAMQREIGSLRSDVNREVGTLRTDVHRELGSLRTELHSEVGGLRSEIDARTRQLFFAIVGSQFTAVALAFAAVRLG